MMAKFPAKLDKQPLKLLKKFLYVKIWNFTRFLVEKNEFPGIGLTDFCSKFRFENFIKYYYEKL
jgi:hypothetical protein